MYEYLLQKGFAENEAIRVLVRQAFGAEFQLPPAFFAGDVQGFQVFQSQNGLQHQR
ncbi:hypothetical protein Barb7_03132 [Bacteroidales bacterium Barb7]|nr:hypothetical protein Barb7_03132 [Bacteroidales bacterium Barb7]